MEHSSSKPHPPVVSAAEWQTLHEQHMAKEKAMTRARDALAAERRRLPMTRIEKDYVFEGLSGCVRLADLFEGRDQLLLYHFMFAPTVDGWPDAGCPGCSFFLDQVGHLSHLHARGVTFAAVSLAPLANIERYRQRMGWTVPLYSSAGSDFNKDFQITQDEGEHHGLSVFLRDGTEIYRTYFTDGTRCRKPWQHLDLPGFTALWPAGDLGGFPCGMASDAALSVVASA